MPGVLFQLRRIVEQTDLVFQVIPRFGELGGPDNPARKRDENGEVENPPPHRVPRQDSVSPKQPTRRSLGSARWLHYGVFGWLKGWGRSNFAVSMDHGSARCRVVDEQAHHSTGLPVYPF